MSENLQQFPIVGIGASAGGVEALEAFFRGIPEKPAMGFIVMTHVSSDRESELPKIIEHYTPLTVLPAGDGMKVEPNHVYVLSRRALLTIKDGVLKIKALAHDQRPRKPIDVFLGSLAEDQKEYAISIILSGSDGDGALGSKAVKEAGGLTMAQVRNGHSPVHPEMPNAAIATGDVDFAIPASEMGQKLLECISGVNGIREIKEDEPDGDPESALENARKEICNVIRRQIGHDFQNYKTKTFFRRVNRRMKVRHAATIENYLQLLQGEPTEVASLFRDLLINVTSFFRDQDAFESLAHSVIPKLFEGRDASDIIRIWIPGCSTGEEVYSIAILLREHLESLRFAPRVQIFGTDIDELSLNIAREGRYPEVFLAAMSPERKDKYFHSDNGSFIVTKDIRELCVFSEHSLIRDPPFSRMDLISCRNLLIYLGPLAQADAISIFHYSLRLGGYLFLGVAENISQFDNLFTAVDRSNRIFQRRDEVLRHSDSLVKVYRGRLQSPFYPQKPAFISSEIDFLQKDIEFQVIENHAPAHIVVNAEGVVVYFSSRTGSFLEAPAGFPTRSLFDLAKRGLKLSLLTAFREAVVQNRSVTQAAIIPEELGRAQIELDITVEPLEGKKRQNRFFLILFENQRHISLEDAQGNEPAATALDPVIEVRHELTDVRNRLQMATEKYEATLEEVRSTNEELISVNEELQSSNEELESSKEEQQSVNEELQTVNIELNSKINALDVANSDLRNLFESTQIASLFLDKGLTIRSFTPAMTRIFNIIQSDRGRPIKDLASRFDTSGLEADIQRALAEGASVEREMQDTANSIYYLVKCNPYRSLEGSIDGVVVSFVDVTRVTKAEAEKEKLQADLIEAQKIEAVALLAGAMAHDFNNLLHVILMKCHALELQRPDDAIALEKLSAIRVAIRTCREIIRSLLLVAKKKPLALQPVDIRQVLEDSREIVRSAVMPRNSVEYRISNEPLVVMADDATLVSAILNLAMNARDAMPDGGTITISCSPVFLNSTDPLIVSHNLMAGKYAEISVSDSGVGMTPEVIGRAFEPFFSTKERGKGTGLGLSGVDRLCRQLNGAALVRNNDAGEMGLTVRLLIPVTPTESLSDSGTSSREDNQVGKALKILFVDDNINVTESTKAVLNLFGHTVVTAANGDEALIKLKSEPFDVMLCDINMPGLMGPDVAAAAENIQPTMSIFLLTGFAEHPRTDFKWRVLEKPVDPANLCKLLNETQVKRLHSSDKPG